jgi:hypothetical protein
LIWDYRASPHATFAQVFSVRFRAVPTLQRRTSQPVPKSSSGQTEGAIRKRTPNIPRLKNHLFSEGVQSGLMQDQPKAHKHKPVFPARVLSRKLHLLGDAMKPELSGKRQLTKTTRTFIPQKSRQPKQKTKIFLNIFWNHQTH